jgi:hypothetical protein
LWKFVICTANLCMLESLHSLSWFSGCWTTTPHIKAWYVHSFSFLMEA